MESIFVFQRGLSALVALFLMVGLAMGQNNLVLSGGTITNSGTIKVKGNITNTAPTSIGGTVQLKANGPQSIGTGGNGAIDFSTLLIPASAGDTKTFNVNSTISTLIDISASAGLNSQYNIGANKLTISGTIADTRGSTLPYVFSTTGAEVDYAGTAQTVWGSSGFTYDKLTVSTAGGDKTMNGDVTVTDALTVSNSGNLAINGNTLTINGSTYNVSGGTVTGSTSSNIVLNGSGNLAAFAVAGGLDNLTINRTGNTITLSSGLAINTAVGLQNGTLDVGTQTLTLNGTGSVITGTGTLSSSATGTVNYAANAQTVFGANYGHLTFGTGLKTFPATTVGIAGNLNVGSATFSVTVGTVDFNGASPQSIPAFTFNNLITSNTGTKTATGNLTIGGTFDNGGGSNNATTLDMATFTLGATGDNTNGTIKFGDVSNGLLFTTGTIEYNGDLTQTIAGGGNYENLILSTTTTSTKNILAGITVGTNSSLTIPSGVTLALTATSALNLLGTSDLTVATGGVLSNAGTIDVGP